MRTTEIERHGYGEAGRAEEKQAGARRDIEGKRQGWLEVAVGRGGDREIQG